MAVKKSWQVPEKLKVKAYLTIKGVLATVMFFSPVSAKQVFSDIELNHQNVVELVYELHEKGVIDLSEAQAIELQIQGLRPKTWKDVNKNFQKVSRSIASVAETPEKAKKQIPIQLPNRVPAQHKIGVQVDKMTIDAHRLTIKRVESIIVPNKTP